MNNITLAVAWELMEDIANNSLENIESPDEFDQPKLNKNFTFNPLEESKQKAAGTQTQQYEYRNHSKVI